MKLRAEMAIASVAFAACMLGPVGQAFGAPAAPMANDAAAAVRRSIPLLQRSGQSWLDRSKCTSCHHQALPFIALKIAKDNGFRIDAAALRSQMLESNRRRYESTQPMYELTGAINGVSGHGYKLLELAAFGSPANDFTDAAGFYLTAKQTALGHWPSGSHRPPIEDSDLTLCATSIRALRVYPAGPAADAAIQRAMKWLIQANATHAEARAMKLLGLYWANAPQREIAKARQAILVQQRADGGWSQVAGRASDSYATGQALMALRVAGGLAAQNKAFQLGARFLMSTQLADGSWRVPTRRIVSGLPYFETGFPHGVDQFISCAGTAWATMALTVYATDGSVAALSDCRSRARTDPTPPFAEKPEDDALLRAILRGSKPNVVAALDRGANPNATMKGGTTALILSVRDPELVAVLLARGADPNLASKLGSTPLSIASATYGALPSMKLLIDAKADLDKGRLDAFEAPIHMAIGAHQNERLKLLLQNGAKVLDDALSIALSVGNTGAIEMLVQNGFDVNKPNPYFGGNSINDAVIQRDADLVALMLKLGCNPNLIDMEGFSPLQVAAMGDAGDSKIVAMLLAAGADVHYERQGKQKPLILAINRGNWESAALIRAEMARRAR